MIVVFDFLPANKGPTETVPQKVRITPFSTVFKQKNEFFIEARDQWFCFILSYQDIDLLHC